VRWVDAARYTNTYDGMAKPVGLVRFALATPARGVMFSARHRAGRHEAALAASPVIAEQAYYGHSDPWPIIPHDRRVSRTDSDLRADTSLLARAGGAPDGSSEGRHSC
jgi:hypothetical protein